MKTLYICGVLALVFFQSHAQTSRPDAPAFYIDGVRNDSSLIYINPTYIDSIQVVKDEGGGQVRIHMKPGHALTRMTAIARDTLGDPGLPTIYLVNGHVILHPESLLLDKGDIKDIQLVRTTDVPSVKDLSGPMALILINLGVTPPSKEKIIHIRG